MTPKLYLNVHSRFTQYYIHNLLYQTMLQLLIPSQLHRQIPSFRCLEECNPRDLSRRKWSPATTGPPDQLRQIVLLYMVPQTNYGFHGWSALPQVVARQKTDQPMVEIFRGNRWQHHLKTTPCMDRYLLQ